MRDEVFARLKSMGIEFEFVTHPPAATIEDCLAPARELNALVPKNLFLTPRNKSAFYLLITMPEAEFRTGEVSRQIPSSRLSFAEGEFLMEFMRTRPGAISPMGLLFDSERKVTFLADERLREAPRLAFHPCENTCLLAMSGADFWGKYLRGLKIEPRFVTL